MAIVLASVRSLGNSRAGEGYSPYLSPFPFGFDYRHRARTSNLMFASKKVTLLAGAPN